ncbi:ABC transporter ATP-binding protein [Aquirufa echingensis]|jgi:lipoprotein-releasing system ATP-binding protein|uniref:ABC transporter ATP-binding protein n=1 Tax=Aquirufa echingensis TaxID=3096516 RepID=A0ABW6CYL9_9BACT
MLELKNISKSYGAQLILNNINLQVQDNQLVSILGPSGSGKSTLLQIIGLLLKPDSGSIELNGKQYSSLKEKELAHFRNNQLGFVFQFHNLMGEFTCAENVKMPLFIRETKLTDEQEYYYEEIVKHLGINHLMNKLPSQLSGGEQQRVAVARALINKPAVLLADEPTGNLDNKNAESLYEMFLQLKQTYGQQIIMVTHNESLTKQSDQVIYLNSGVIQ